jgi:hypothetical protein
MKETTLIRAAIRMWGPLAIATLLAVSPARAQKAYGPGVSDTEIKLGQSTPLSGPASAFGAGAGRAVVGYFEMLNAQGGVNGRKSNNHAGSLKMSACWQRSVPSARRRTLRSRNI